MTRPDDGLEEMFRIRSQWDHGEWHPASERALLEEWCSWANSEYGGLHHVESNMTRPKTPEEWKKEMARQWNSEMTSDAMRKARAATPPPNDLPECWHDTYDEPRYVRWPVWLFLATAALIGAIWGNV